MQSTLEATNDYTNPSQPEITSNNASTNEWTQGTSNDLMVEDIITSNEMKVADPQIINNYQQQQPQTTTTTTTMTTQTFVDSNANVLNETTDTNNNNNNNEQIDKIEQVQQQQQQVDVSNAGINGFHNDNNNNNDDTTQQQQLQQQVVMDNNMMDVGQKEEEEENEQTQVTQQEMLNEDEMSKDVSIKTASESVESAPHQNAENVQQNNNNNVPMSKKGHSWAAFLKGGKPINASPKRRAIKVNDHVSDKLGAKGKGQGRVQSKNPDVIRRIIDGAIKNKDIIWISYNGHQKPFIPRAVKAIQWDKKSNENNKTFFAVQHRSKSQNQQRFFLKYVVEVRDKQWRISNADLDKLKRSENNPQWTENGPQRSRQNNRNSNNKRGGGGKSNQSGQGQRAYTNQQQQQGGNKLV